MLLQNYIRSSCTINTKTVYKNGIKIFENKNSGVWQFLESIYNHFKLNYPRFYKMDNLSKLGWLTSELLLKDDFNKDQYQPEQISIVITNASSSLDTDIKYFNTIKDIPSPSLFVYTLPNIMIGEICIRNNFKGENAFFVSENFDAAFIQHYVSRLLNNDFADSCICGWIELLQEKYKAVLFYVEKRNSGENFVPFTKKNISSLFNANCE